MAKQKKFDDIRLREETIRNMQQKRSLKKPKLKGETLTPMSTDAIKSRREKLKKPKLKDITLAPMSKEAIQNRKSTLKKPKLNNSAKGLEGKKVKKPTLNNSAKGLEGKKVKKPTLNNSAKGITKTTPPKKPQLSLKTQLPMNKTVIKRTRGSQKKPTLNNSAKGLEKKKVKKPTLNNSAKGITKTTPSKKPQLSLKTQLPMNKMVIKRTKGSQKKPKLESTTQSNAKGKSEQKYPVPGFFFKVQIKGFTHESHFKEVSGLTAEREVELIVEGGNNDYVHKVPKGATKYNNLVLKRGLISSKSALGKWCLSAIGSVLSKPIKPKTIDVELQDPYDKSPVMKWSFTNAWPVKWEVSGLDSQKSEILIESIEFAYNSFSVS